MFLMLFVCLISFHYPTDFLVAHIGKTYESVVTDSTFPVLRKTAMYPSDPPHPSSTWVSSPAIIHFDDPEHGFKLPATKFGAIGFDEGKVSTMTTSPMLETVPFDEMIVVLDQLQSQLRNAGWVPWNAERNPWVKTSTEDAKKSTSG